MDGCFFISNLVKPFGFSLIFVFCVNSGLLSGSVSFLARCSL